MFLLWWPRHFPATGVEALVLRGVVWTLTYEVLYLAFRPLERRVAHRLGRRVPRPLPTVRRRLDAPPAPARTGAVIGLAALAL